MKTLRELFTRLPADGNIRQVLRNFNMAPKAGGRVPSVKDMALALGFEVERISLPFGMAGRLVQDAFSQNGYRIEVNQHQSVRRQRWTVLHEMGHYFLHVDRNDSLALPKLRDRGDPLYMEQERIEEREADEFAAVLLFADGALTAAKSLLGNDLHALARHFGVSEDVIRIALRQF